MSDTEFAVDNNRDAHLTPSAFNFISHVVSSSVCVLNVIAKTIGEAGYCDVSVCPEVHPVKAVRQM